MAICQTTQWVNTSPYVKLTVEEASSTETTITLRYTLYYEASSAANTSVAKSYTISIGNWSKSDTYNINGRVGQYVITTGTIVIGKTNSSRNIGCSFGFNLTWSGVYCDTKTASTYITIAAKNNYKITYNANGGTGAPSAQTKWYGEALTLSSTRPTRTGYTFQGWGTSTTDTTADYQPGASYTANAGITLYAIWKANTYTVTYNANGGTGAPANQTKTYGQTLTLTTSKPTRTNYTFKGWATTPGGAVSYQPGGAYTNNSAITLYAVWESSYVEPILYNVSITWAHNLNPYPDNDGVMLKHIYYSWYWKTTYENPMFYLTFIAPDGTVLYETETNGTGTSGEEVGNSNNWFSLRTDVSYTVKLTATDAGGSTTVTTILPGEIYPIDVLAGGKGISFGGPASLKDTAHFQWDARFDKSVCGNVPGMYRLPEIPANADFNNYMTTGCWAVYKNANAETIANIPVARAGRLEVWSATGEGIRAEQWSYLRQRFIPYNNANATWERDIARGEDNVWHYYDWHRTTLTPEASEKIYSKSAISVGLESNVTLGVAENYTKIPFDKYISHMGDKLTIQNNAVRIGAGITRVKVSGQTLVKCGNTTGNRHARIQTVNDTGVVISNAWVCLYATANSNTVFAFTPILLGVREGWTVQMVYYTSDTADANQSGSYTNGYQTYITVEEL